jgi:hypothetical protein
VSISIENQCNTESIAVYWVTYGCEEDPFGIVSPGNTFSTSSYRTHPWRIRNATSGALLAEVPPLTDDTAITFP